MYMAYQFEHTLMQNYLTFIFVQLNMIMWENLNILNLPRELPQSLDHCYVFVELKQYHIKI